MISRLVTAALGTLIMLAATTHTRTVEQAPYSASDDDCGMFNCSAIADTSEVGEAHCSDFRIYEDSSSSMVCDGKVVDGPATRNQYSRPADQPYAACPFASNDHTYVLCADDRAYHIEADGNYVYVGSWK